VLTRKEKYLAHIEPPKEGDKRALCHSDRKHYARGMCIKCYDNHNHQKNYPSRCEKKRKYRMDYWRANRERLLDRDIERKFNLAPGEYKALVAKQNGVCAICGRPPRFRDRLCVDHSHTTEKNRELLCITCNAGLGQFYDDPNLLETAAAYLRKHAV